MLLKTSSDEFIYIRIVDSFGKKKWSEIHKKIKGRELLSSKKKG